MLGVSCCIQGSFRRSCYLLLDEGMTFCASCGHNNPLPQSFLWADNFTPQLNHAVWTGGRGGSQDGRGIARFRGIPASTSAPLTKIFTFAFGMEEIPALVREYARGLHRKTQRISFDGA